MEIFNVKMELLLECLRTLVHSPAMQAMNYKDLIINGTCLANQSWGGGDPICVALNCSNVTMVADDIITSSCDMTYQSQCTVSCDEGFTGDDVTYLCNVTSDPTIVDWVPIGGVDVMHMCESGLYNLTQL